jgi:hypothetical protein
MLLMFTPVGRAGAVGTFGGAGTCLHRLCGSMIYSVAGGQAPRAILLRTAHVLRVGAQAQVGFRVVQRVRKMLCSVFLHLASRAQLL